MNTNSMIGVDYYEQFVMTTAAPLRRETTKCKPKVIDELPGAGYRMAFL